MVGAQKLSAQRTSIRYCCKARQLAEGQEAGRFEGGGRHSALVLVAAVAADVTRVVLGQIADAALPLAGPSERVSNSGKQPNVPPEAAVAAARGQ